MAASETCAVCGQEVRWGHRDGVTGYLHRDAVDHHVKFGRLVAHAELQAELDRELDRERVLEDGTVYTTRGWQIAKMAKAARLAAEEAGRDPDEDAELHAIPPPEIYALPIEIDDPRLPGGCKSKLKLARKHGWEAWVTHSRGPRVHGTTQALIEMSDVFVLRMRLDGTDRAAVASWWVKNGKPEFEVCYLVTIDYDTGKLRTERANSDGLKAWINPPPEPIPLDDPYEETP
jgi:hypothetical protein